MGTLARRPRNSSRARAPNLHAVAEPLGEFRYERGITPCHLRQQFGKWGVLFSVILVDHVEVFSRSTCRV
jgi:hypothetical protein